MGPNESDEAPTGRPGPADLRQKRRGKHAVGELARKGGCVREVAMPVTSPVLARDCDRQIQLSLDGVPPRDAVVLVP